MPSEITITLHTADYRGDHAADVEIATRVIPGETVEQLVERSLAKESRHIMPGSSFLTIRRVPREAR